MPTAHRLIIVIILTTLLLFGCITESKIISISSSYIEFNIENTPKEDADAADLIRPYRLKLETEMNIVLAVSELEMFKGVPEGILGNFITDLTLEKGNEYCIKNNIEKADICLLNNGGLRTTLPKGDITKRRIFELMPFENELVVLTLSGQKTKGLFDFLARVNGMPLAGASLGIDNKKPVNIIVGGDKFEQDKTYRILTSDYLAEGGDKMRFFLDPIKRENLGNKLRDAIIEYVAEQGDKGLTLSAQLNGRIYLVK
ncbi:MAG TPA: hypothetical protein EYM84_06795 [Flavobacteriales bacterium]|nr:hypothetical protein [Flavobacteriales bacterium]HIN39962.1 hypothetical protein [Flavobacteriales bacterium]